MQTILPFSNQRNQYPVLMVYSEDSASQITLNMPSETVYLDFAATTPVDPRVVESMLPYFTEQFGNPSSTHFMGQRADLAVEKARTNIAKILNCSPAEVIFTGCGSESDNIAIRGLAYYQRRNHNANHILLSPVEHHAVTNTVHALAENHGFKYEFCDVDKTGKVVLEDLESKIRDQTALVSVIYANNEIGTINSVKEIGSVCRRYGVPFHTDAVQAAGYLPVVVDELQVDLMSLGSHKFYGPKGVGALYIREEISLDAYLTGGGQERSIRSGTHNVPLIVGFSEAFLLTSQEKEQRINHVKPLRDRLIQSVLDGNPRAQLTGHPIDRLPNHASFIFEGIDGNQLLMALDMAGFACSSGSACRTGSPVPSETLIALGYSPIQALSSLRVTLGNTTTLRQIDLFTEKLSTTIKKIDN
jgi:cysteine desulfurase